MKTRSLQQIKSPPKLTPARASEILWGSIFEAFLLTFMILILGGLGLSMAAGIWKQMIPEAPPLTPALEAAASPTVPSQPIRLFSIFGDHKFAIVFGCAYAIAITWQSAWEAVINSGSNLTGSFGGWRRCSLVTEPLAMLLARALPAAIIPASPCYLNLLPPP